MDVKFVVTVGRRLKRFLGMFNDCFSRSEPRAHLATYVNGQVSTLKRKSVEPMALKAGTPPRTLQRFLESMRWDERRLRDRMQQVVARHHADPRAIGIIDESGYPKDGKHTACVARQWCGHLGKVDNCVVAVHAGFVVNDFHCILDSDLYLPESWRDDLERRRASHIPDDVTFRKKADIALGQVARALSNGIRVAAWTFDAFYGRDRHFLDGLQGLGQNYVGGIPRDFTGWLREPTVLLRPTPQEMRKPGKARRFPRLARQALPACEVRNLVKYSPIFRKQTWQRFRIRDGEQGPVVWEVKHAPLYRKQTDGLSGAANYLIVTRNVLDREQVKYFVSNMLPSTPEVSLRWLLWIAFSRHPIEQCFRQGKDELGMDHFEVRGWDAIHRHLYISQLSHLFCARVRQEFQSKKNDGGRVPYRRDGAQGRISGGRRVRVAADGPEKNLPTHHGHDHLPSAPQPGRSPGSYQGQAQTPARHGHRRRSITLVRPARLIVATMTKD
jgi:SRSO17 transposase